VADSLDEAKAAFRARERPLSEGGADVIRSTLAYLLMTGADVNPEADATKIPQCTGCRRA
jgi:hypothetical protein